MGAASRTASSRRKAEDPLVDPGEHVFDRSRATVSSWCRPVRNARSERARRSSRLPPVPSTSSGRRTSSVRSWIRSMPARSASVSPCSRGAERPRSMARSIGIPAETRSASRTALRRSSLPGRPGLEAGKGEVGLAHRREGEVAPQDVALGPLQGDASPASEKPTLPGSSASAVPGAGLRVFSPSGTSGLRGVSVAEKTGPC